MAKAGIDRPFVPSGFFAFRTPLLPFEELEALSEGLAAASALDDPARLEEAVAADKERLRARIRELLDRPEVQEAVFLASPSLFDGLDLWRSQPDSKKGQRAERALVRYLFRMAARATPFGLFSGCSLGPVDESAPTHLNVVPRSAYERHTRLDMDYLFALCEDLGQNPEIREELLYRPNSSLYRAAGRLRYAEARLDRKVRTHHLVAVDGTEYLEDTLRRAANGARARDLAQALVDSDPDGEITFEEAREYIDELIDSQLLVSDLWPTVTGPEAIHDLIAQLQSLSAPIAQEAAARLIRARDTLEKLDASGAGSSPEPYRELAKDLEALPTPVEMARLFQLDMVKAAENPALGGAVLEEIMRGVEVIQRLTSRGRQEAIERFRSDFTERYGDGREVPLVEVLDEEIGIGFERATGAGAEASPLLQGLPLAPPAADPTVPWGQRQGTLFRLYVDALSRGRQEVQLTEADLDRLAPPPRPGSGEDQQSPLPRAFQVMATIAAESGEALNRGEFQVQVEGVGGPSGARLLGRFCHADPNLHRLVEEHLRAEEALRADAVFAEVVHLPQGRIGNILSRPVLREYEIPYLGRSGAPPEKQIPITDLLVSVSGGRIVLRSRRLGKEVIPALTSAHNFWTGSLGMYRFLCILQSQGVSAGGGWTWGPLDGAPFLPRVTFGRILLSRATWYVSQEELKELAKTQGAARFAAVRSWAAERRLPRLIALADGDNELLVDLDNFLSVDTFVDVIEGRDRVKILEFFPTPEQLWARGPEGRFVHELVIPFVRVPQQAPSDAQVSAAITAPGRAPVSLEGYPRTFAPGSEWLFAKLYTGTSTADRVLVEAVAPVVRQALGSGAADGWFFIRYSDPGWHVRVRFHGDPAALQSQVVPALQEAVAPMLADGRLWQVLYDTYQREVERYGGPEGMPIAERLFQVDSEAVLAILEMIEGDEGTDARWRLALRGADMLLSDLGLQDEAKLAVLGQMRESFGREFGMGKGLRVQLDQKFRAERKSLDALLDPANDETSPLAPGLMVLHRRSQANAPLVAELERLEAEGRLTVSRAQLAPSFVHMHVNRMIRSAARAHELAIYDLLYQLHQSRAARARGKSAGKPAKGAPKAESVAAETA
ncbi:MAG TPA: lantibiotic dehydratase [Thermoanaerobaculia bacterium]|nr:lantibiotic dehydratase [Thermoanaerobaculia bacterium]